MSADFLGTEHTVRHVREGWQPRLVDRQNYAQWEASGATSMRDRARAKIDEILAEAPRHVLPPDVEKQIKAIATSYPSEGVFLGIGGSPEWKSGDEPWVRVEAGSIIGRPAGGAEGKRPGNEPMLALYPGYHSKAKPCRENALSST